MMATELNAHNEPPVDQVQQIAGHLSGQQDDDLQAKLSTLLCAFLGLSEQNTSPALIEFVQHLSQQDHVFNAFHDLAETVYSHGKFQFIQQEALFEQALFIRLLQHGRVSLYPGCKQPVAAADASLLMQKGNELPCNPIYMNDIAKLSVNDNNDNNDNRADGLSIEDSMEDATDLQQTLDWIADDEPFIDASDLTDFSISEDLLLDDLALKEPPLDASPNILGHQSINSDATEMGDLEILPIDGTPDADMTTEHQSDNQSLNTAPVSAPAKVKKMIHFQIPNARVGQPYHAQLKTQGIHSAAVILKADSINIPADIGIRYNPELDVFEGTPTVAGDYQIHFLYQKDQDWRSGVCTFIVTADPRSLWQIREPDPAQPYAKPHTAQQFIESVQFKIAAASRRGRSHEHAGGFRDDDFYIQQIEGTDWSLLIVADGAGSAGFSREGSRLAVEEAAKVLETYILQQQPHLDAQLQQWQVGSQDEATTSIANALYKEFHNLFYKVAQQAIARIDEEALQQGVASKAFATTLLAAVVKHTDAKTFVSTFWVGDGAIAVYSPNKMRLMGMPDGGEFAGQTRFLDKSIAQQFSSRVNIGYYDDIQSVILMTDGISDPRFETDAGLLNQQKWDALWQELQPCLNQSQPDSALLEWMHFFSAGHHDDRTLAILWSNLAATDTGENEKLAQQSTIPPEQGSAAGSNAKDADSSLDHPVDSDADKKAGRIL